MVVKHLEQVTEKKCLACNKVFSVTSWYVTRKKFCSKKCYDSWRQNKTYEEIYGPEKAKKRRELLSEGLKRAYRLGLKKPVSLLGRHLSKQAREKMSKAAKTRMLQRKGKTYEQIYGVEKAQKIKEKMSKTQQKMKEKKSEQQKEKWRNPQTKEMMLKRFLSNITKRPTSYETKIINLCEQHSLPFKYVGDGQIWIAYKNPDFIETNGKKLLIEVYDQYWHSEDYEESRGKLFSRFGFKTLFLSQKDLTPVNWQIICLQKIQQFLLESG